MKKMIVFVTCQRTGSSFSAELFYRHGMSLGPYSFFMASPDNPLGLCETTPVFQINHALHELRYGFGEDSLPYDRAGKIMKARENGEPENGAIPHELIEKGTEAINAIAESAPVSGFKHPATILFWSFWQHVFQNVGDLEVIPVFLLRSPTGIAASYARRAKRPEFQDALFDLIEIYFSKMMGLYRSWNGPKPIVRFTEEHYRNDLKNALETCGFQWVPDLFDQHYQASATVAVDEAVDHPVQNLYSRWLELCSDRPNGSQA